jgi:hypothetical protein
VVCRLAAGGRRIRTVGPAAMASAGGLRLWICFRGRRRGPRPANGPRVSACSALLGQPFHAAGSPSGLKSADFIALFRSRFRIILGGLPPLASEPGSAQATHAVGFECVLPTEEFFRGQSVPLIGLLSRDRSRSQARNDRSLAPRHPSFRIRWRQVNHAGTPRRCVLIRP